MPGHGLWYRKNPGLGPDPARSLVQSKSMSIDNKFCVRKIVQ